MTAYKGYYSVIQFCPDLMRLEAANIGVLLFCPELRFLAARIARDNDRVRKFFGSQDLDWQKLRLLKAAFEDRVAAEAETIRTLDQLQEFIDLRANQFRLTKPRSIRIEEPQQQLRQLFEIGRQQIAPARTTPLRPTGRRETPPCAFGPKTPPRYPGHRSDPESADAFRLRISERPIQSDSTGQFPVRAVQRAEHGLPVRDPGRVAVRAT
jgi:hypothetical protein